MKGKEKDAKMEAGIVNKKADTRLASIEEERSLLDPEVTDVLDRAIAQLAPPVHNSHLINHYITKILWLKAKAEELEREDPLDFNESDFWYWLFDAYGPLPITNIKESKNVLCALRKEMLKLVEFVNKLINCCEEGSRPKHGSIPYTLAEELR
jgi:hypothetical protein